ncbi:ABC transporter substrate-binding protein [Kineosporia succinea]|uniref:Peptide/nickel transport system substrate-binding protein n=1 Tax=Kineosporia succinea TaxID=84632 RepID=A0ABT9PA61_9ACTN|nr:ABC transporter substrate-binding protein [Kineosporia succinea]MDP9829583.1 peptide/nickel transport system substrate-binding protein [Kineosporia succinea]
MRTTLAAVAGLLSLTTLAACSSASTSTTSGADSATPVSGGSITWAVAAEPSCFAPAFDDVLADRAITRNVVDSLVYQEKDGTYTPWLASAWETSKDGITYTFTLRDDVKFSSGATLDAAAVKANLDYTRDSAHGSSYAGLLGSVKDITADKNTLTITLSQADSSLLSSLSSVALGIIDPATIDDGKDLCTPGEKLSGSGPFVIDSYTRGSQVVLKQNADYAWAPESLSHDGPAYLDQVTYKFIAEDSTRTGALQSGQVDAISGVPALSVASLTKNQKLTYTDGPASSTTFGFTVNGSSENAPWDDAELRKAFRDSFDLDTIVNAIYKGQKTRAWSWVGKDSAEFDTTLKDSWGNDPSAANAALDAAGWSTRDSEGYRTKDGKRLRLKITYDADSVRDQRDTLVEAIQDAAKKNTGIEVDFTTPTWAALSADIAKGDWSIYPGSYGKVDYANSVIGTWNGYFYGANAWKPTKAVDLATDAIGATDPAQYKKDLDGIQQYLVKDQALFVPLVESTFPVAASNTLHGNGFDYSSGVPDGNYNVWVSK